MKKKAKKESGETTRDSVKKEMAMSRVAESGREAASKYPLSRQAEDYCGRDTDLS